MIDDAIFTAPPRGEHSGAALLDDDGALLGIASLWVSDTLASGVASTERFRHGLLVPSERELLARDILILQSFRVPAYGQKICAELHVRDLLPDVVITRLERLLRRGRRRCLNG